MSGFYGPPDDQESIITVHASVRRLGVDIADGDLRRVGRRFSAENLRRDVELLIDV